MSIRYFATSASIMMYRLQVYSMTCTFTEILLREREREREERHLLHNYKESPSLIGLKQKIRYATKVPTTAAAAVIVAIS